MTNYLRPLKLNALPVEILGHIASYLYRPSQLNNLCRTCKHFKSVIEPRLYKDVSIILPRYWSSLSFLETLLGGGCEGLKYIHSITVCMQNDGLGAPSTPHNNGHDEFFIDSDGDLEDVGDVLGRVNCQPRLLNTLIRLLINQIPAGQLETFRWYHTTLISERTMVLVAKRHGSSLKSLRIYNTPRNFNYSEPTYSALRYFDAGDLDPFAFEIWAPRVVTRNRKTLSHVTLGCEVEIINSYLGRRPPMRLGEASYFTRRLLDGLQVHLPHTIGEGEAAAEAMMSVLTIESLRLIGIDCSVSPQIGTIPMLDSERLTSLCLESCFNLGQSLSALCSRRSPDAPPLLPRLRSFKLRQEGVDELFRESLKAFLLATDGIVHLSVLLQGWHFFLPPDCLVNHGSTLRTLVWDQRLSRRRRLDECTNTASSQMMSRSLETICHRCPNLVELGLAVEAVGGMNQLPYSHLLPLLKDLKTLNIRNLPLQPAHAQTLTLLRAHELIAMDVAKTLLGRGMQLEVLGLGAMTWTDIWQGRSRQPPFNRCRTYLCPRIYYIQYPVNVRGERQPLVTQIAQGTANEAKEYSSDLRVFEPYWLP